MRSVNRGAALQIVAVSQVVQEALELFRQTSCSLKPARAGAARMNFDDVLPSFIAEATELLREMETRPARLLPRRRRPKKPSTSIFRTAHTIKGSAGLVRPRCHRVLRARGGNAARSRAPR